MRAPLRPWTETELALLRERYPGEGGVPLVAVLQRNRIVISKKARAIGLTCRNAYHPARVWSDDENRVLREQWPLVMRKKQSIQRLAERLHASEHQVRSQAMTLCLSHPRIATTSWSDAENDLLEATHHLALRTAAARFRHAGFRRSESAIASQRNRQALRAADSTNAYSANGLSKLLGITDNYIQRWIRLGWLKATPRTDAIDPRHGGPADRWLIYPKDVRRFLLTYTAHIDPSRADKYWLFDLLAGGDYGNKLLPTQRQEVCGFDEMRVAA